MEFGFVRWIALGTTTKEPPLVDAAGRQSTLICIAKLARSYNGGRPCDQDQFSRPPCQLSRILCSHNSPSVTDV